MLADLPPPPRLALNPVLVVVGVLTLVLTLVFHFVIFLRATALLSLWFQAKVAGVPINLPGIVEMRFRKVDPKVVVRNLIMAKQAGIELSPKETTQAYLRGVDLDKVTRALILAKEEGTETSFQELVEADLTS